MSNSVFFREIELTKTPEDSECVSAEDGAMQYVEGFLGYGELSLRVNTVIAELFHNAIDHSKSGIGSEAEPLMGHPVTLRVEFDKKNGECAVTTTNVSDRARSVELNGRVGVLSANKGNSNIDFHYFGEAHTYGDLGKGNRGRGLVQVSRSSKSERVVSEMGGDLLLNTVEARISIDSEHLEMS